MKLYITLNAEASLQEETQKIQQSLDWLTISYIILGSYENRGHITIVVDILKATEIEDFIVPENILKQNIDVLEVDHYMKFYYILQTGHASSIVNPKVRAVLEQEGYKLKIYNSHSENGLIYIGLKIMDINPLNKEELNRVVNLVKKIEGISDTILY